MTSQSHKVTQTKHKNRQAMEAKNICLYVEDFIDRSIFGDFQGEVGAWLHKTKKCMVKRVKQSVDITLGNSLFGEF